MEPQRIPIWLKLAWTLWIAVWIPLYWIQHGPHNFLWFCDIANLVLLAALWSESSLLVSWQACSVLLVQIGFSIDVLGRVLVGRHPIGGTQWIFDDGSIPWGMRLVSLGMHVATPPLLLWALRRVGYDRRGFYLQIATACVILPISFLGWDEKVNLNWVWGPFNRPQQMMPPALFVPVCILGYLVLLYLPTHLLLSWLFEKPVPRKA